MSVTPSRLGRATLRANPGYELLLFDRLPVEQQQLLAGLTDDPDFYGVLQPRDPGAGRAIKSICRETALLFLTLQTPGSPPAYLARAHGGRADEQIAELVLDGVLEVECNGAFVAGPAAFDLLYGPAAEQGAALNQVARLSLDALRYAQALEVDDSAQLSARLYFYNRVPASPRLWQRFPTRAAIADYLGIGATEHADRATRRRLDHEWRSAGAPSTASPPPFDGWRAWQRRDPAIRAPATDEDRVGYKLYVSPAWEAMRDAFAAVVAALSAGECHHMKVGKDLYGVLRPDKLVAYFWSEEAMQRAARDIAERLPGCPAQGVPFTNAITADGLLSWGIDPPAETQQLAWLERESWRLWVTNRLATALVAARSDRGSGAQAMAPWEFALHRIRLDGVDPESWTPTATMWRTGTSRIETSAPVPSP